MSTIIDSNEHYTIFNEMRMCCGENQFRYVCKEHETDMGCYFCEFDYSKPCGHGGQLPASEMKALRAQLVTNAEKIVKLTKELRSKE